MEQIIKEYERVQAKLALRNGEKCDKYDYLIAISCGVISGMIDVFAVGKPGEEGSALWRNIDKGADELVKKAAQLIWRFDKRKPSEGRMKNMPDTIQKCIQYLENAFPVCYDASSKYYVDADSDVLSHMRPINHHIMSLSHSPDIVGLWFSLIDQFTDIGSYIDNGHIIRVKGIPKKEKIPLLQGTDFLSKMYCGVFNWIGHILSDLVGANTTRAKETGERGSGVGIPFYELFLLFDTVTIHDKTELGKATDYTIADLAIKVFEEGYDLRFGVTMTIPVLINELLIQLLWALKRRIYHSAPWKECIPSKQHSDLRCMLLIGETTLCVIDAGGATIKSNGQLIDFLLHINIIAWFKLAKRIFEEIMIRYSFTYEDVRIQFEYLNHQLSQYLEKLKSIDYEKYRKEIDNLNNCNGLFELNDYGVMSERLHDYCVKNNLSLPCQKSEEIEELLFINEEIEF